jgi:hypothetical protein
MLSYLDRKGRLPFGALSRVAERLDLTLGHVSEVMHGRRRDARVEKALAKLMAVSPLEAFGEPPMRTMLARRRRKVAA